MNKLATIHADVEKSREEAAVGTEFAANFIERSGVKFYYATVAHKWVLMKLSGKSFSELDDYDKATVMAYVLAHKMPQNLSRMTAEMRKGDILDKALAFFSSKKIDPDILAEVKDLLLHPYESDDSENPTNPESLTSTGGAD